MSKRILFFILFSWLAPAAFPAFAQQKTDTVYTFRFVPQKDTVLRNPRRLRFILFISSMILMF